MQFIGVSRTDVHFNLAVEEQTKDGTHPAHRRQPGGHEHARADGLRACGRFYIVELLLDEKNQGAKEKIHAAALLDFPATGSVTMQSYRSEPQMLVNVRQIK